MTYRLAAAARSVGFEAPDGLSERALRDVLSTMARLANDLGEFRWGMSVSKIAQMTGYSLATVKRAQRYLVDQGYLERAVLGGGRSSTRWRIVTSRLPLDLLPRGEVTQRIRLELSGRDLCVSPIEQRFWAEHVRTRRPALDGLVPQHSVLRYRIDFALLDSKIGVELDGYEHHKSHASFVADRIRQRDLEREGWRLIRFAGREVVEDVVTCVDQVALFVEGWSAAASA